MTLNILPNSVVNFIQTQGVIREAIYRFFMYRSNIYVNNFENYLKPRDNILDIGSGPCHIAEILYTQNYSVTALDIKNISFSKKITPIIYDGNKIPFKDNEFDTALLIGVLHHVKSPQNLIKEAKRVAKKIIIMEDIYYGSIDKYITYFFDSLVNLDFGSHPHNNKTDPGWRKIFKKLDLNIIDSKYKKSWTYFFNHATYFLEK